MIWQNGIGYEKRSMGTQEWMVATAVDPQVYGVYSLKIPEKVDGVSVEVVGRKLFAHCILLQKIHLPSSIREIEDFAFIDCALLETVEFYDVENPAKYISLGSNTFANCISLKKVQFVGTIINIGTRCFSNCTKLKKLGFAIQSCQGLSFENCVSLESLVFRDNCCLASTALKGCSNLKEVLFLGEYDGKISSDLAQSLKKCKVKCAPTSKLAQLCFLGIPVEFV